LFHKDYFQLGTEIWPNNGKNWAIYAKFIAIYPEESQHSVWIMTTLEDHQIKGGGVKTIKTYVHQILIQRKSNLIPNFKRKIDEIDKLFR
jgi:hypothetical protein